MRKKKAKGNGRNRTKNQNLLAERYQKSSNTIRTWIKEGAPRRKGGYYNLRDWDAWVEKYHGSEVDKENTLAAIQLEIKREELFEKRRIRAAYERKMVDGDVIEKQGIAAAKRITSILTRIPPQIGSILGVEAQRRAQVVVEEALNVLKEDPLGVIP